MANIAYMNELQQQPPSWLRCSCNSWGCGVQATTDSASQHAHILWLGGGGGGTDGQADPNSAARFAETCYNAVLKFF